MTVSLTKTPATDLRPLDVYLDFRLGVTSDERLALLNANLSRAFPVADRPTFADLLAAIDEAQGE